MIIKLIKELRHLIFKNNEKLKMNIVLITFFYFEISINEYTNNWKNNNNIND